MSIQLPISNEESDHGRHSEPSCGYKKTDAGIIPSDWETASLGQITFNMIQGVNTAIDKPEYVQDGIPMLKANNVIDEEVVFEGADHVSLQTFARYNDRFKLKKNDFLFSNIGARLGTGSLLKVDVDCTFAWNVMRIVPNAKRIIPDYLCFLINSPKCSQEIRSKQSGSGMGFIPKGVMQGVVVPVPPLPEQRAIAAALSDVDELIGALDKLIAKKRAIKLATMQQLLTGKTRLPGFSGEWREDRLENVADCLDNLRVPLNETQRAKMPGPYPYCGANGVLDYVNDFVLDDDVILIAEDGGYFDEFATRPIAYRMNGKIWVNNHAHILKAKDSMSQAYLYFTLVHKNIMPYLASGTRAKLNKGEMNKIEVRFPVDVLEQEQIGTILSDMNTEIAALEQRRKKTRAIKQGMMQALLTGRVRLVEPEGTP